MMIYNYQSVLNNFNLSKFYHPKVNHLLYFYFSKMSRNEENIEPNLQHQEVSPSNEGNNNKQFVGGRATGTRGWKAPESHELIKQAARRIF